MKTQEFEKYGPFIFDNSVRRAIAGDGGEKLRYAFRHDDFCICDPPCEESIFTEDRTSD